MNIETISAKQYLDIVNAEASPDAKVNELKYYRLGNQVLAHLFSGAGNFLSEPTSVPEDKTAEEVLTALAEELRVKYNASIGQFRPTFTVFTPITSWPLGNPG